MAGADRTLAEDRRFDEYFGCGVGRRHSGQDTGWPIGSVCCLKTDASYEVTGADRTLAEDRRFDEYFGFGVGRGHSGQDTGWPIGSVCCLKTDAP